MAAQSHTVRKEVSEDCHLNPSNPKSVSLIMWHRWCWTKSGDIVVSWESQDGPGQLSLLEARAAMPKGGIYQEMMECMP